jgi:hypothetical protein
MLTATYARDQFEKHSGDDGDGLVRAGRVAAVRTSHAVDCLTTRGNPAYTTCRVALYLQPNGVFLIDAQGARAAFADGRRRRVAAYSFFLPRLKIW